MKISEHEQRVLARVIEMIGSDSPTSQSLDDYLIGYNVLGRLVAIAQGEADHAEMNKKVAWSEAFAKHKTGEEKMSDALAKAHADLDVRDLFEAEVEARRRLTNLKNTRESLQEVIWGIKYLGRNGG